MGIQSQNNSWWLRKDSNQLGLLFKKLLSSWLNPIFQCPCEVFMQSRASPPNPPQPQEVTDEEARLTQASCRADVPASCQLGARNCALWLWPLIICLCGVICNWNLFESWAMWKPFKIISLLIISQRELFSCKGRNTSETVKVQNIPWVTGGLNIWRTFCVQVNLDWRSEQGNFKGNVNFAYKVGTHRTLTWISF